uniref:Bromo domain-containing protein n=1 Tax=Erpetoichthys calabaricus TaxID=27687 RepID=A0A8C4T4L0_ERPCA
MGVAVCGSFGLHSSLLYLSAVTVSCPNWSKLTLRHLNLSKKCQYLLIKLYSEDKKRIFGPNPNYTDYSEYIEKPMWLDKIKDKLTSGLYDTVEQFFKDIHLIFSNCAKFNKDNKFGKIGHALRSAFDADFKHAFGLQ